MPEYSNKENTLAKASKTKKYPKADRTKDIIKFYPIFSLVVLLGTTLFWSIRSANIQLSNSDQLINPLLMQTLQTFKGASFPGAHTQLIKWPIFWLISVIGTSNFSYDFFTVLIVLITVGALVYLLYKINNRSEIFGTLVLALSGVLLLIPAQPYSGGLLPVNMAMISTRNLEYPLFIFSLLLLFRKPNFKSWPTWLGIAGLSLLIASDKLFASLTIGGALLALIVFAITKKWNNVTRSVNWLIFGVISAVIGSALLWIINLSGLTHISDQASASPYSLVSGFHQLANGVFYAFSDFFTNFGANPAFDGITRSSIPHLFTSRLFSLGGPAYIVNFLVVVAGLTAAFLLLKPLLKTRVNKSADDYSFLALALIFSSIIMFGIFIFSNHEYTVDSRYLTICLFSVFIAMAVISRQFKPTLKQLKIVAVVLVVGLLSGLYMSNKILNDQANALNTINNRNAKVVAALNAINGNTLVGDYWRVPEIKLDSTKDLDIIPLSGCTSQNSVLTSTRWNVNLDKHSFAYLLTLDRNLTNYPSCTINNIISAYGRPNRSYLIAGSLSNPEEKILFYGHGINKSGPVVTTKTPSTILPVQPGELPYTTCNGPTVLNFVAHEDDDLLFMNPQIYQDITAGNCVRTVYLTAGDAGLGSTYWLGREKGVQAAYDYMIGNDAIWVDRIVNIGPNEYIDVTNPRGNSKVTLVFMHLPDGNLKGQGFASDQFESLQKLWMGQINTITSVDQQSSYTSTQLIKALESIMNIYGPGTINTQSDYVGGPYPDHSDHIMVSNFVKKAYAEYETDNYNNQVKIPINYYIGYPIRNFPANVSGANFTVKINAFVIYGGFDGSTCHTIAKCLSINTYSLYLPREYTNPI